METALGCCARPNSIDSCGVADAGLFYLFLESSGFVERVISCHLLFLLSLSSLQFWYTSAFLFFFRLVSA